METSLNISESSGKKLIKTFSYLLLLFLVIIILTPQLFLYFTSFFIKGFSELDYITRGKLLANIKSSFIVSIIFAAYLAILNTLVIEKTYKKAFYFLISSIIILFILITVLSSTVNPYFAFLSLAPLYIAPIALLSMLIGAIGKRILKIESRTLRTGLLLLPFIVTLFLTFLIIIPGTSAASCNNIIFSTYKRNSCYIMAAQAGKDGYEMCHKIEDQDIKEECLFRYVNYNSDKVNDEICSAINLDSRLQYGCYETLASKSKDHTQCLKITNQEYQDDCLVYFSRYLKEALSKNICDDIASVSKKDNCYQEIGIRAKNATICQYISNQRTKDFCLLNVSGSPVSKEINIQMQPAMSKPTADLKINGKDNLPSLKYGSMFTLSWSATNAKECRLSYYPILQREHVALTGQKNLYAKTEGAAYVPTLNASISCFSEKEFINEVSDYITIPLTK